MSYQVFSDMDGVLVNFEGGVLRIMNKRFQELKDQPDHPDYKLARFGCQRTRRLGRRDQQMAYCSV